MGIKDFIFRQMLKSKLKELPESQQEVIMALVEKNPELFKEIGEAIKRKTKAGMSENAATMQVMREYQGRIQKLMK
ncbi:MAG: hypothetical protein AAB690_00825 [Patescibacteria group bacterium]